MIKRCLVLLCCLPLLCSAQEEENYYGKENGKKLDWAIYYLDEYYVDSLDTDAIAEAALRAIAAELDPYSVYQTAEELKKQKENDDGTQFIGIGINTIIIDNNAYVTSIAKGSPAEKADVKKGDIVFQVDGDKMKDVTTYQISDKLKGDPGTEVKLTLIRDGKKIKKKIVRSKVPLISVETSFMLTDDIGYIKLIKFTVKTIEEFNMAYSSLQDQGMKDLVLDMRHNNGGVFLASVDLASQFLQKDKMVVYTDGVVSDRKDYKSTVEGEIQDGKVLVLTDGVTASASEVFVGAMQDWDRALVLGAPTFGKGLIQQSYGFSDSSAIRLTIGKYFRPSGQSVQRSKDINMILPSHVYVGSETAQFIEDDGFHETMGGRKVYSLGAGIVPDVFYPIQPATSPNVRYKYIAGFFVENKNELGSRIKNLDQLLHDAEIASIVSQLDPEISEKHTAEVKGWLAALLLETDDYYQSIAKEDVIIQEAIKRLKDDTFDRLGISY